MRISERQRSFKKGIDADLTRRRREGTTVQIRKTIKEDRLNQRRRIMDTMVSVRPLCCAFFSFLSPCACVQVFTLSEVCPFHYIGTLYDIFVS